jgi:hypothetical protein
MIATDPVTEVDYCRVLVALARHDDPFLSLVEEQLIPGKALLH